MKQEKDNGSEKYWRSLEDLAGDPAVRKFEDGEFPDIASDKTEPLPRRSFLKIMGATAALAGGVAGCRFPVEKIVPYAGRPMNTDPGVPLHFTTAFEMGGLSQGLLVKSYDGRPVKIEGNPKHPLNQGASNVWAQASLLDLYDPDRSKYPIRNNGGSSTPATWEEFEAWFAPIIAKHKADGGRGLYVLSELILSPTLFSLRHKLFPQPHMRWFFYEHEYLENIIRILLDTCVDKNGFPVCDMAEADVIVSLDSDFLYAHPLSHKYAREFAQGRTGGNGWMKRLYMVETNMSVTGAAADVRIPMKPSEIYLFAKALAARLYQEMGGYISVDSAHGSLAVFDDFKRFIEDAPKQSRYDEYISAIVADIKADPGHSVIMCGFRQPQVLHYLASYLNDVLMNTVKNIGRGFEMRYSYGNIMGINDLARVIERDEAETLLIIGGNPVYDAPSDLNFREALKKVRNSIHLSIYNNETSAECSWHIPRAHYLESWGDVCDFANNYSVVQPVISPLYGGKSPIEVLSWMLDENPRSGYELVKNNILNNPYSYSSEHASNKDWEELLHKGYGQSPEGSGIVEGYCSRWHKEEAPPSGPLEINFVPDNKVYDGRFANNAWLQELPDPITKLTWGNAALMSPATAKALGVERGDVIKLNYKGRSLEIPALPLPGHADGAVTVPLGYGRTKCGRVGDGVGANAYAIRTSDAPWFGPGLTVEKTGRRVELATTQDHQIIKAVGEREKERRRTLQVREADLEHFRAHPDFAQRMTPHHPPLKSLWKEYEYKGHRWAMAIDLSRCIGCNACIVACQAENNIPVVGKQQVLRGREMHWIRVDRWFSGDPANPNVSFQPVPCQQCENAPCESVCPVGATVHSSEGLNDMVYNRCIGMRFCSNNCPYKVRRFNYFLNNGRVSDIQKMVFNPEVTMRGRGVMEKCTYCVQRIQEVKIRSKNERRAIADGEITPACAQACPSGAIVFGDLNDPASRVKKLHEDDRAYAVLAEYNLKPRTAYLAKIRNPPGKSRK